ncbi:haloacid dehalogenase [Spirochaetia bacterium]|nr:haloacid dehalogenase [Spirochaetia bacterium]GHT75060.1 haloacid dehalogenase [Spirochaetia bacterium]
MENIAIDAAHIKALALDLDGTVLAPGAVLRDRTAAALRGCLDRGIRVIFCTGRAVESAERYRAVIGAAGPMVCYNGAEVVRMPGGDVLGATLLDREVVDFCLDLGRSMGVYFQAYFPKTEHSGEILMAEHDAPEAVMYRNHTGIQPVFGDMKAALAAPGLEGCIKAMFLTEQAVMDRIRPLVRERFGERVYIAQTQPTFLEVMDAGVSKGNGLAIAIEQLGLKACEVLAIGDEENDLPMFSVAGYSAAPANAKEPVRQAAQRVIGSCGEDGVAVFLEDLFELVR